MISTAVHTLVISPHTWNGVSSRPSQMEKHVIVDNTVSSDRRGVLVSVVGMSSCRPEMAQLVPPVPPPLGRSKPVVQGQLSV